MKTIEVVRQHSAIKSLIKRAGHTPATRDIELLAHWGRYVCILTSGFVESYVRHIYGAYLRNGSSSAQTIRFATRHIDGVQNPKAKKLVEIASSFDLIWGRDLETYLDKNFRGDAIDSIMSNRHLIAHGRSSNITLAQVEQYFSRAADVAAYIEIQCGL